MLALSCAIPVSWSSIRKRKKINQSFSNHKLFLLDLKVKTKQKLHFRNLNGYMKSQSFMIVVIVVVFNVVVVVDVGDVVVVVVVVTLINIII